jgi:aspartate carbamoyltransferase catalytic subunit
MRSFAGRDILSLKDFEREEFFRVFEVGDELKPFARDRRNADLLKHKTLLTAFYQPSTRTRMGTSWASRMPRGLVRATSIRSRSRTPFTCWSSTLT